MNSNIINFINSLDFGDDAGSGLPSYMAAVEESLQQCIDKAFGRIATPNAEYSDAEQMIISALGKRLTPVAMKNCPDAGLTDDQWLTLIATCITMTLFTLDEYESGDLNA